MKKLIWLLLISCAFGQTWGSWNGITVGTSAGNIGKWDGVTIGTTAGNIGKWDTLTSPGGTGGAVWTRVGTPTPVSIGTGASNTCTVTYSPTAGNLVVVYAYNRGNEVLTAADSGSNALTARETAFDSVNSKARGTIFTNESIGSGITSFTVTGYNFNIGFCLVIEYHRSSGTGVFDVGNAHNNGFNVAAFTSNATATTAQAHELAVGCVGDYIDVIGTVYSVTGAWSTFDSYTDARGRLICGEQLDAAVAAYTFSGTGTTGGNNTATVITEK